MTNTSISKTLGPIHFEDLDPKRFEDLIRELVYDYRDWQTIEATGRAGGDEGFDIRAFEKTSASRNEEANDDDRDAEESAETNLEVAEGRVWMFQCKREKEIGPSRVASIVADNVDAARPPYGYVLAAPANFSKESFDVFREELRKRGVMEFQLWGRAALEDMLHQPKNDRILFTFFGISLLSRRRSRATEVRSSISAKNRLKTLFSNNPFGQPVLLRDIKDSHYPYKTKYPDFDEVPRWKEYPVVEVHPLGLIVTVRDHYAFVDEKAKTWDYTEAVNLVNRKMSTQEQQSDQPKRERVEDYWRYLPSSSQVRFIVRGLVRFDSMVAIDPQGDVKYDFPHIFVDFQGSKGPFRGYSEYLERDQHSYVDIDGLEQVDVFPKEFPEPRMSNRRSDRSLQLPSRYCPAMESMRNQVFQTYDCDKKYEDLNVGDLVTLAGTSDHEKKELHAKITHRRTVSAREYLDEGGEDVDDRSIVEEHIGRQLTPDDDVEIIEFRPVYSWQV